MKHYTGIGVASAPPVEYNWFDIIRILKENGLEIKNIKKWIIQD